MGSQLSDLLKRTASRVDTETDSIVFGTLEQNLREWLATIDKSQSSRRVTYGHALNVCLLTRRVWANYLQVFATNPHVSEPHRSVLSKGFDKATRLLKSVTDFGQDLERNSQRVEEYLDNVFWRRQVSDILHKDGIDSAIAEMVSRASKYTRISTVPPSSMLLPEEWAGDPDILAVGTLTKKGFLLFRCGGLNQGVELLQEKGPAYASAKNQRENGESFVLNPSARLQEALHELYPDIVTNKIVRIRLDQLRGSRKKYKSEVVDELESVTHWKSEEDAENRMIELGSVAVHISTADVF